MNGGLALVRPGQRVDVAVDEQHRGRSFERRRRRELLRHAIDRLRARTGTSAVEMVVVPAEPASGSIVMVVMTAGDPWEIV